MAEINSKPTEAFDSKFVKPIDLHSQETIKRARQYALDHSVQYYNIDAEVDALKEEKELLERSLAMDEARKEATKIVAEEKKKLVDNYIEAQNTELLEEVGNGPRKYIDWYYGEGSGVVDWCAIFVSWIFNHNGDSKVYATRSQSSAIAGEDTKIGIAEGIGTWYESEYTDPSTTPKAGDVVTFNKVSSDSELKSGYDENGVFHQWKYETPQGSDHVGYVYAVDDEKIYTIEGNANSYDASAATVTTKEYYRNDIKINGYYRPDYEKALQ